MSTMRENDYSDLILPVAARRVRDDSQKAVRPGPRGTGPGPDYFLPELNQESRRYRGIWLAVALLFTILFGGVVFTWFAPADAGVDQNAYLVGGRLLAEHFSMKYVLPNPYAYAGEMFVRLTPPTVPDETPGPNGKPIPKATKPNPDSVYIPKYPFGLPLLYAGFFWVFKAASLMHLISVDQAWKLAVRWAFIVSPVSAVLSVVGVFFLARLVSGSFAATLAAIVLGTSQLMLMLADNPNSHASCMAFIVWGMFFCVRWLQTGSHWRGILGGLLVGYAATIRYNEVLLFVVMCVVVLSRLPWNQWKSYLAMALLGSLVGMGLLIKLAVGIHEDIAAGNSAQAGLYQSAIIGAIGLGVFAASAIYLCLSRMEWPDWRMYLRALVPGLAWSVPVGILLLVNLETLGSATGYDSTHESEFGVAFQWRFFWQNWEKVVREFYDMGLFFVLPFAVAGLVMVFRRSWRIGLMLIAWVVPGVMLYMAYYFSPDFGDAYARFFLTYLPALAVGMAVCLHDGILERQHDSRRSGGIALTLSAGLVVLIASGVSTYRTVHGLRDGSHGVRMPVNEFRERLSLARTGEVLMDKVPANSVLFAENTGGLMTPIHYIQFAGDWELYSADTFSLTAARRGSGPPDRGVPGGNGANNNVTPAPTPIQREQRTYHASLYRNKTSQQLSRMQAEVVSKAFAEHRKVFAALANEHVAWTPSNYNRFDDDEPDNDSLATFKEDLNKAGAFNYKVVARWQDVVLPEDRQEDLSLTDNSPMGGGRRGGPMGGGPMGGGPVGGPGPMGGGPMMMGSDRVTDWELVEICKY